MLKKVFVSKVICGACINERERKFYRARLFYIPVLASSLSIAQSYTVLAISKMLHSFGVEREKNNFNKVK